jgi:hypothetical protein
VNYIYSDALQQNTTSQSYKLGITGTKRSVLPANTKVDDHLQRKLRRFFSGVNYLQGPSADDLQGKRNIFSNERRI